MFYNKIHLYYGNGKGKTTAAVGLAVRAAGSKMPVLFCEFLKDGSSGEIDMLNRLPGVDTMVINENFGFTWNMTERQKNAAKQAYSQLFISATEKADVYKLIVFDEIIDAINADLIDKNLFIDSINHIKHNTEIVLTGHNPPQCIVDMADYVSCVTKVKHPFDVNLPARKGIEF
ncbi:MAG: cob(I)yrinic acid a,c-diamide adenosyltransferase [Oscillospiraceae bacterium]|nr:cob(I)yrinic acid a,c-diamide adenosyltransferase [Oscillospiraceae bacterium]